MAYNPGRTFFVIARSGAFAMDIALLVVPVIFFFWQTVSN